MIVYALCANNCKYPTMTTEQILAAIAEATGTTPTNIDDAFISKLVEQNKNATTRLWIGTEAEYNAVVAKGEVDNNTIYCIKNGNVVVLKSTADIAAEFDEIRTTAQNAANAAANAQTTADNAATAAQNAVNAAGNAATTASNASAAAANAQETANNAATTAGAAMPKSGGTFTGEAVAQNNTNYTTKQVRNVFLVAEGNSLPTGANGDICLVYTP